MAASRLIILGVAVAAAGGAGYVAKNMVAAPPPEVVVERPRRRRRSSLRTCWCSPATCRWAARSANSINWQSWPADGVNANFITRDAEPEALEKLKGSSPGCRCMPASRCAAPS